MSDPNNNSVVPTCKSAELGKTNANTINANNAQETIHASGVNVGNNPALGAGTALNNATINANNALASSRLQAEMQKQVAIDAARDSVRGTYLARS